MWRTPECEVKNLSGFVGVSSANLLTASPRQIRGQPSWRKQSEKKVSGTGRWHRANPVRDIRTEAPPPMIGSQGPSGQDPKPPRKKRKQEGEDKSVLEGGIYTHNRRGVEVCGAWNKGQCGINKPQSKCMAKPKPRSHQCNRCLGPHQATACNKRP